jgi:hypothetical protein
MQLAVGTHRAPCTTCTATRTALPACQPDRRVDCRLKQVNLSEAIINYGTLILQQRVTLQNVPVGSARVVFDKDDFCNFLNHPLMKAASTKAVQVPAAPTRLRQCCRRCRSCAVALRMASTAGW